MLIEEFKQDYFNNMSIDELKAKYQIGQTTYFTLLKKLNIKRRHTSKIAKILGENFKPDYLPKKIEPNNIDETDEKLIYEKQYVPRNTTINVEKQKTTTNKPKPKPVAKKEIEEQKTEDTNNKSELLNAINRSTKVREKILNKKNSN